MISVVIPAKDEVGAITETVAQVRSVLAAIEHEVIVVDDGSSDGTGEQAKVAGARVIRHPHNLGYGAALKSGIRVAQYDTIVITDADGTYPNDQIPSLLARYQEGFDMVVGARGGENYHESIIKAPLRKVLQFLVEYTAGYKVPDVNSGLRIFSRETSMRYFYHLCNTFSFTTSLTLAYMMTQKFVTYMPIAYYKRTGTTKVRLFRDMLRTLQYILEAIIYYNPLKIFLLLSGMLCVASIISVFLAPMIKLMIFYYVGIGGFLLSIIVFCFGLMAVLLRQIMIKE